MKTMNVTFLSVSLISHF
jgi:hypothetical protein